MGDGWRVSLRVNPVFEEQPYAAKRLYFPRATALGLLRSRFGEDTVISAESTHIFIYAATAEAAAEAARAARDALAQQDISAGAGLERWVPSDREWRDVREEKPGLASAGQPAARKGTPRPGRVFPALIALVRSAAKAVTDGAFP